MAAQLKKALLQTHKDLIDAVFHRGEDPRNRLLDLMSPDLHGCGTARHEIIQNIDDYLAIFDGEINELPVGLKDKPINLRTTIIGNVAIVHGAYELLFKIENENALMYVRLTVVYEYTNEKWQAVHLHGSEPSAHIAEGETWPVEALKAQNEELKKTVAEKTADLEQKNNDLLVEVALEKVRSRTMAMQNSSELAETTEVLHQQLVELGIKADRTSIAFPDETSGAAEFWSTDQGGTKIDYRFIGDLAEPHHGIKTFAGWKQKLKSIVIQLEGEELTAFINYYKEKVGLPFSDQIKAITKRDYTSAYFSHGWITLNTSEPLSREKINILERFAAVFDLTYTRFLDLQKAEAQTRESQIELGLERVRARAMGMQNSDELKELISTVFAELTKLDLALTRCLIMIYDPKTNGSTWWMANSEAPSDSIGLFVKYHEQPPYLAYIKAWQQRNIKWQYILEGRVKKQWDDFLFIETELSDLPDFIIAGMKAPGSVYLNASFNNFGNLTLASLEPLSNEQFDILLRFAKVFDLTYTRFNDLKQAEAQAKGAKIEASLERVRTQTAAMNKSSELGQTASVIFSELDKLELQTLRCGIGIFNKSHGSADIWTTTKTQDGYTLNIAGNQPMDWHPVLQGTKDAFDRQEDFFYILQGEDLDRYYRAMGSTGNYKLPESTAGLVHLKDTTHYYYCTFFPSGGLYFFRENPFTEEIIKVIRRFADAFSLAYKRFEDLKQSEARTLDAIKASSLDRVRAEISSMRTTADLERITPLIWNELTTLGVPFIRCGVFIMDEDDEQIHTFLSTPDGKAIAAFKLPFTTPGTSAQALAYWRKKEIFTDHWDEAAFKEWTANLVEQGLISSAEKYAPQHSPANLHLYFLPFLQGMLYVGSEVPLGTEEINLAQTLANAFSTAYSRFEDFNKLESAKQQIEKTLVDLKLTQSQLIQSEKMASLGELTAGIAHEIQNPLNFVNNFSEVSIELIEEVKSEKSKIKSERNEEFENELLEDISQNLQKISHHGKRADFIVKGMLQHSRTSTGEKQPTNINALADEFLKLSYHGLRAKDKSFNAELKTNFNKNLPKINVVQQDIGRVLLNLFNNAFYAVQEKRKVERLKQNEEYKPIVEVSTLVRDGFVVITVKDNGCGIPEGIKEKIMQPFFTTKPTGEGTGLGLSLSYDIVKAHGGELKVKTTENEGTEFIIELPVNKNES